MTHWFKYFFYITCCFSTTAHAAIPETERNALIALYDNTAGDLWRNNSGWMGGPGTECQWLGVSCSEDQHIIEISLSNNGLKGEIPKELATLKRLQKLDLSRNGLKGSIPLEIGELTNLITLSLYSNQLSGKIPSELSHLSQLEKLSLSNNDLSGGIPPELGILSHLQELFLSTNPLGGSIPEELAELSQLRRLYLSSNLLSGEIPVGLAKLNQLTSLNLSNNNLSGSIPKELGQLNQLTRLNFFSNQLTGNIPSELGQLGELKSLHFGDNQFTGTIPQEIGQLSTLRSLSFAYNKLTGTIDNQLNNISNLSSLSLNNNCFNFGEYAFLQSLADIKALDLGSQDACQDMQNNDAIVEETRRYAIYIPYIMIEGQAYAVLLERYYPSSQSENTPFWRVKEINALDATRESQENLSTEYDLATGILHFNKIHLREQVISAELLPYTPPDYAEEGIYFKYVPDR